MFKPEMPANKTEAGELSEKEEKYVESKMELALRIMDYDLAREKSEEAAADAIRPLEPKKPGGKISPQENLNRMENFRAAEVKRKNYRELINKLVEEYLHWSKEAMGGDFPQPQRDEILQKTFQAELRDRLQKYFDGNKVSDKGTEDFVIKRLLERLNQEVEIYIERLDKRRE